MPKPLFETICEMIAARICWDNGLTLQEIQRTAPGFSLRKIAKYISTAKGYGDAMADAILTHNANRVKERAALEAKIISIYDLHEEDERAVEAGEITVEIPEDHQVECSPTELPGVMRAIVSQKRWASVNGILVDMQTANMWVTVYEALSPEMQETSCKLPLTTSVKIFWKCVK